MIISPPFSTLSTSDCARQIFENEKKIILENTNLFLIIFIDFNEIAISNN
jgi:hypothetical protein